MAKTKISQYDSTANNNTDINNIDIAEGCAPSGINNAIREMMAQLKNFQTGSGGDAFAATQIDLLAQSALRFQDTTGGEYVAFRAPTTVATNVTWTLPAADGTANQFLKTDGSGALSWDSVSEVYPGAGVAVSTGSSWGTSLTAPSSALVGISDTQTLTNKTLTGAKVTVSALGTLTTGTTTLDLATAQVYTATITASDTITIAFSNAPSAGQSQVVLLRLIDAGGGTIVWPANTKFTAGAAPTLTASGVDVLGVYYDVTTTTYMVFVIGLDVKVP
jgi:hypothetical protein